MGRTGLLYVLVLGACGGGGGGTAQGTAKMLNGPSPGAAQTALTAPAASDGSYAVTPTKLNVPITGLQFVDENGTGGGPMVTLTDCAITFDLLKPGLAQSLECPFELPAGSYVGAGPYFGSTFDLTIDDAVNGIYTDPSAAAKVTTTAPSGGGQSVTLPDPRASLGPEISRFDKPFVVNDGDMVTVSILLDALQTLQVTVTSGQAELGIGGNNMPGLGDAVTALGTPARVSYYVNPTLGTPYTVNGSAMMEKGLGVAVLYSTPTTPAFLAFTNGRFQGCPAQTLFVFPGKRNGYLGIDSTGELGWAAFSDVAGTMYSSLFRMKQADALAGTTTFECASTTTDPMPPGDSFSSGAPMFTPAHTESMTLVVN